MTTAIQTNKTAAQITKEVSAIHAKTPALTRRTLESIRAQFVNMRGMKYEGSFGTPELKTIKNSTGADLETVKAQLDHISAAFASMKIKGHETYLAKVAGLMKANINNNSRYELARKEAAKEAAKTMAQAA